MQIRRFTQIGQQLKLLPQRNRYYKIPLANQAGFFVSKSQIRVCIVHLQSRYIMFPLTRGFSFLSCCERNETKKANQGEASKMPIPLDNPLCYVGTHTLRTVPREQTDKPEFVKLFIVGKRCSSLNRLSSRLRAGSACQILICMFITV